jgi:hypothetical protein
LMLLIGLALEDNAGGQPAPPPPAFDKTMCDQAHREAFKTLQNENRASFHRSASAESRPVVCHSDCTDPLPPEITDVCKEH